MEMHCVLFESRTGFFNIILANFGFKTLKFAKVQWQGGFFCWILKNQKCENVCDVRDPYAGLLN
jgi:hypothetical protein